MTSNQETSLPTPPTPPANPYRPGAGHAPPHLAGREAYKLEFRKLLVQDPILTNMILTGVRGLGKTVLLDALKPIAVAEGWLFVGNEMSESACVTEDAMATRILTDLSLVTSSVTATIDRTRTGFAKDRVSEPVALDAHSLLSLYTSCPGLPTDKLGNVLATVWEAVKPSGKRGIVFAYDEAQNLADKARDKQYPMSMLLQVFQSLQKQGMPMLLVLAGLPTLLGKLVEARTYSERMFRSETLSSLSEKEARDAIVKPLQLAGSPFHFTDTGITAIIQRSSGYPYFVQFICREVYDVLAQQFVSREQFSVPWETILQRLDTDFYAGRWAHVTDRQRDLLTLIAHLPSADGEFTIQQIVEASKAGGDKPFSMSQTNKMLKELGDIGMVYKNRHGKYSFAVPLLGSFILRQEE